MFGKPSLVSAAKRRFLTVVRRSESAMARAIVILKGVRQHRCRAVEAVCKAYPAYQCGMLHG